MIEATTPIAPVATAPTEGAAAAVAAIRAERAQETAASKGASKVEAGQEQPTATTPEQPAATEPSTPETPQASTIEIAPQAALKMRLRSNLAQRRRELDDRDARIKALESEATAKTEAARAEAARVQAESDRIARLQRLQRENPEEFLKETGFSLEDYIKRQLAQRDPKQQARVTQETLENLPQLIAAEAKKQAEAILKAREDDTKKQTEERQRVELRQQAERTTIQAAAHYGETALPNGEKAPLVARLAKASPDVVVAMAHVKADVFRKENGRHPSFEEVIYNLERDLRAAAAGDETAPAARGAPGTRGTPRSAAKEGNEKPIAEMSERERMAAAVASLRKGRADERTNPFGD